MNRQDREFYGDWVKGAREAGATEAQITEYVDGEIRDAKERAEGRCPKCAAPVMHRPDERQAGPPAEDMPGGAWIMWWCSRDAEPGIYDSNGTKRPCGYRIDLYEVS